MWHPLVTANATQITPQNQRFDLRSEYPLCGLASNHFSKDNFYFILFHRIGSDLFRVGTPHPRHRSACTRNVSFRTQIMSTVISYQFSGQEADPLAGIMIDFAVAN